MPINEPKTPKPEDIINDIFYSFAKGFTGSSTGPTTAQKAKTEEPVVDSVKETHRLLKKAETVGENEAAKLLSIADRHIAIIDIAISSQK